MLIIFGTATISLHEVLLRYCSLRQTLLLGFAGTVLIIAAALSPVVNSREKKPMSKIAYPRSFRSVDNTGFSANSAIEGERLINKDGQANLRKTGLPLWVHRSRSKCVCS